MKLTFISKTLLAAFVFVGISNGNAQQKTPGIDTSLMDKSVSPKDDFFKFVNGTWLKNTEIPQFDPTLLNQRRYDRVERLLDDLLDLLLVESRFVGNRFHDLFLCHDRTLVSSRQLKSFVSWTLLPKSLGRPGRSVKTFPVRGMACSEQSREPLGVFSGV